MTVVHAQPIVSQEPIVLTDIVTATPPTIEDVAGAFNIYDADRTDHLAQFGFETARGNQLRIKNLMHGGTMRLLTTASTGDLYVHLATSDLGGTSLWRANKEKLELVEKGAAVRGNVAGVPASGDPADASVMFREDGGASIADIGFDTSADLSVSNLIHGGAVRLTAETAAGSVVTLLHGDPDGAVGLYHGGTVKAATSATGLDVTGALTATGAVTGSNLNVANWDTAFGWGNHGTVGYLTSVLASNVNSGASSLGDVLTSDGAGGASWVAGGGGGGGDVSVSGTPADNQLAVWTDATTIEGDSGLTWDGNHLLLPQENGSATPTLGFGSGNMGIYASTSTVLCFANQGLRKFYLDTVSLRADSSTGFYFRTSGSQSATPSLCPRANDTNTGVGSGIADTLSFIAGGVEGVRITESGLAISVDISGDLTADSYGGILEAELVSSDGTTGGAGSAGSGNQYVELVVGASTYKLLHDGTV